MRCPICDHETEERSRACPTCGSKLKVVETTLSPEKQPVPYGKILLGLGLSFCALALCFILTLFWEPENLFHTGPSTALPDALGETGAYISYDHHYTVYQLGGRLAYAYDRATVQTHISNTGYQLQHSLDGSTAALLANTGSLLLLQGTQFQELSAYATDFALSSNGQAVLYLTTADSPVISSIQYYLYYYHVDSERIIPLVKGNASGNISDIAISPDGMTVAYVLTMKGQRHLMRIVMDDLDNNLFITQSIPLENEMLLAVGNGWSSVYLASRTDAGYDIIHYNEAGTGTTLGSCGSYLSLAFNADNSQILFYANACTYLSADGQPPVMLSDYVLSPILPANAQEIMDSNHNFLSSTTVWNTEPGYTITYYPFLSFYDHAYYGLDGLNTQSAWYISEEGSEKIIVGPITAFRLDSNGYLYYVTAQSLYVQHSTHSMDHRLLISQDITLPQLEIDPEGRYLYFMCADSFYLFDTSTAGEPELIYAPSDSSDDGEFSIGFGPIYSSSLSVKALFKTDEAGNLYFLVDGTLMVYDPKQDMVQTCLEYISYISSTPNGIVSVQPNPVSAFTRCIVSWDGSALQYIYIS